MKKSLISLLSITAVASLLAACSATTDPSEAYKNETPQQIYQKGKSSLQEKSFSESIKRFEALDVQYPFGPETENAQLYLIYAYYMKEDYTLASAEAERFIRIHPTNPHIDYAYYMLGLSNYYQNLGIFERLFMVDLATRDLTQLQKAYVSFNEVVTRFPQSRYAPSAHQYLVYIRDTIANHEEEVAEYYYHRKAYVAAANRAADVVAHYQGAPAVRSALVLMVKSYHQLGLTKMEQDTLAVLRYNYPNATVNFD